MSLEHPAIAGFVAAYLTIASLTVFSLSRAVEKRHRGKFPNRVFIPAIIIVGLLWFAAIPLLVIEGLRDRENNDGDD